MSAQTSEQALEATIQTRLTGTSLEALRAADTAAAALGEASPVYGGQGYRLGLPEDFDARYALDTHFFWEFLERTQARELDKLRRFSPNDWQAKLLERLDRMIKRHGVLSLLKQGLAIDDAQLTLMYPAPLPSSGDKVAANFASNIFSCTRQVHYSLDEPGQAIDMVLFVNGLPVATLEFKNAWTGQTASFHGRRQYMYERDASQPLLQFARCLVHMAVDADEVYMTTRLNGGKTFFLPFNKGHNLGQGNPPNPEGHKTAYLWEDIFTPRSLANLIQHFILLDGKPSQALSKRTLFFPRFHQLDVVRKLVADAEQNGVGHTYLIQHSAGSGKSNSITWAAYQLIEAYPQDRPSGAAMRPLFDSVVVVTDRRLLDQQIRDNIHEFSEVKNIVQHAEKSANLRQALEAGKKIIITTIQKFPFIVEEIGDLSDRRFAVIIDEAHSSQSGLAHDKMNQAMGSAAAVESEDSQAPEDRILAAMNARKIRHNASYFAFTATPRNITLEKFGDRQADGSFAPFHLYSMKQAIEEGFILDVLANYTTYRSYYEIQKSVADNPLFDGTRAQKKLRAHVEGSQQTINVKAEVMLDHFVEQVVKPRKLKGKARGMVVAQSIEMAIRYYWALRRRLAEYQQPFQVLIAFSGEKTVDGITCTEAGLNGFADSDTAAEFDQGDNRLLVVANKYLTGFDQPKLCAMYVDKKLAGVQAVQALSRLNRVAPKLGKRTEDLFVLDFFNTAEDIQAAFEPFFAATTLSEPTDVNVLHDLKDALDAVGVYESSEVVAFNEQFFAGAEYDQLAALIDPIADRFNHELGLDDEDKVDFKVKAKQFVKIYGQMAAIIPFDTTAVLPWEQLFWLLKFLIPKLAVRNKAQDGLDELLESVDLSSYGLKREGLNQCINLRDDGGELEPQNPNPRGAHDSQAEADPLDEIVRAFNDRWFRDWSATPEEQRVKFLDLTQRIREHPDYEEKYRQEPDQQNRELVFERILKDVMLERRRADMDFYRLFASDEAFKAALKSSLQSVL